METLNFAFVLQKNLLINIRNSNLFVCGFKVNTPVLQYSNTPCGLSKHSQLTLAPSENRRDSTTQQSLSYAITPFRKPSASGGIEVKLTLKIAGLSETVLVTFAYKSVVISFPS